MGPVPFMLPLETDAGNLKVAKTRSPGAGLRRFRPPTDHIGVAIENARKAKSTCYKSPELTAVVPRSRCLGF